MFKLWREDDDEMNIKLNDNAKKVGFLGIGQAGGNLCEVAEYYKYRTLVLNTSPEDLNSITIVKNKKLLGSKGGCGKDRNEAKSEVKSLYKDIVSSVKQVFSEDIEIVYVVFSTGGGTGSGMSPIIIDILNKMIKDIHFVIMPILPSLDESIVSQINTLECLKEIYKLNLPTIIIDNEKYKNEKEYSRKKLFDIINTKSIMSINSLFLEDRKPSKYGNIDQKDLFKLLTTPGVTIINESLFTIDDFINKGLTKIIMDGLSNNIYADIDYDGAITRSGYIFEIDDNITGDINLTEINRQIGTPLEVFEGYYKNSDDIDNIQKVISILSGLSFPETRLELINEVLEKSKESIKKRSKNSILDDGDLENDWFNEMRDESVVEKPLSIDIFGESKEEDSYDDIDLDNLFDKY